MPVSPAQGDCQHRASLALGVGGGRLQGESASGWAMRHGRVRVGPGAVRGWCGSCRRVRPGGGLPRQGRAGEGHVARPRGARAIEREPRLEDPHTRPRAEAERPRSAHRRLGEPGRRAPPSATPLGPRGPRASLAPALSCGHSRRSSFSAGSGWPSETAGTLGAGLSHTPPLMAPLPVTPWPEFWASRFSRASPVRAKLWPTWPLAALELHRW